MLNLVISMIKLKSEYIIFNSKCEKIKSKYV